MNCTIILDYPEYDDEFGHYEATHEEHVIPFRLGEIVWYVYKEKSRWVIRKSKIQNYWATNLVGVKLDNNNYIIENSFYRLFKNENDAVDFCLKENQRATVRIYNKNSW